MSVELYSVTIRCDYCDEVIRQSGTQRKDITISSLRNKMHKLGWKSVRILEAGKRITLDYCPNCSFKHRVG